MGTPVSVTGAMKSLLLLLPLLCLTSAQPGGGILGWGILGNDETTTGAEVTTAAGDTTVAEATTTAGDTTAAEATTVAAAETTGKAGMIELITSLLGGDSSSTDTDNTGGIQA